MIYFDNAATTAPIEPVNEAVSMMNNELYANSSALHSFGFEAEKLVEKSRKAIADLLGVKYDTITFTSGGTESNNIAILGYLKANPRAGKHIITSAVEHPSVLEVFKYLVSEGYEVTVIDVDSKGAIDYESLYETIRNDTALISIMTINNETGAIQDFSKISAIRNEKNIKTVIHSDCVQAFGKIKILPEKSGIDMLSISGHKFHGPKGVGALYIKKGIRIFPVMYGGGHEKGLRPGTLNTPSIAGLYHAVDFAKDNMIDNYKYVMEIKHTLIDKLSSKSANFIVNGDKFNDSPYILNISFPGVKSEVLLHHLAERKIYVSSRSACSSHSKKYSHVLSSMMLDGDVIDSSIRVSFSYSNTVEEAVLAAEEILGIVPRITYKK